MGKTTTAVSLAAALAARDLRILLIDADPQANATSALGQRERESGGDGLYGALVDERPLESAVVPTATGGLSLVPTTPSLAGAEVELVSVMAREFRMKRVLEPLRDRFDFVIIDCPPSLGLLTVNALAAADRGDYPGADGVPGAGGARPPLAHHRARATQPQPVAARPRHRAHDVRRAHQPCSPGGGRGGAATSTTPSTP